MCFIILNQLDSFSNKSLQHFTVSGILMDGFDIKCYKRTNINDIREMKKDNKVNKAITEKQTQSNILRIAINYIQTFSLLLQLKFEWPTLVYLLR